jgi:hypothetical protein
MTELAAPMRVQGKPRGNVLKTLTTRSLMIRNSSGPYRCRCVGVRRRRAVKPLL